MKQGLTLGVSLCAIVLLASCDHVSARSSDSGSAKARSSRVAKTRVAKSRRSGCATDGSSAKATRSSAQAKPRVKSGNIAASPERSSQPQNQTTSISSQQTQRSQTMMPNTLTGFVNKYGESPAAYKMAHGMTQRQALQSTPDSMCSSGEIQMKYAMGIE